MPGDFASVLEILLVILTAMTPISELRGAILLALQLGMSPVQAYIYSVFGNMLPVIPLLLFLEQVSNWLRRYRIFDRFFDWLFARTRRYNARMEKYGALGLASFVAIPLPITGAWTGCAVAFVFGIRFKYAFPTIFAGVLIAGVIMTLWYMGMLVIF
ncbi:MAG TPA: ligand-binding protein SH3 [Methanomicrobia archaeon]|nr:ligand-binding protein SH3 [Methanomicrobia archaeon]